jgi:hypothetical protein
VLCVWYKETRIVEKPFASILRIKEEAMQERDGKIK